MIMDPKNPLIAIPSSIKIPLFKTISKFKLPNPSLINQRGQTYTYQMEGTKNTTEILRVNKPIPHDCAVFYMEILCQEMGSEAKCFSIAVDFESENKNLGKGSSGVRMTGSDIYFRGAKAENLQERVKKGDHLGVGFIPQRGQTFFTHHGKIVSQMHRLVMGKPLFVMIILREKGQSFQLLEKSLWKFPILEFSTTVSKQVMKSISQSQNLSSQKYNMVYQYLQAANCPKTALLLKEEIPRAVNNVQFHDRTYTRNPTRSKKILQKPFIIEEKNEQKLDLFEKGTDQEMLSPLSSSMKICGSSPEDSELSEESSSASDSNEELLNIFRQGDYGEAEEKEKKRKVKEKKKIFKQKVQQMKRKQKQGKYSPKRQKIREQRINKVKKQLQQDFLQKQLPSIISMLKNQSPVRAYKELKSKLPQIFQIAPFLDGFFSACIFLQMIKKQGPLQAIQYAKKDQHLRQYESCLFRFIYEDNSIQEKPLRDVLRRLNGQFHYEKQIQCFSEYLQELILDKMGYYSHNTLELYLQYTNTMKKNIKKMKVPCCGVEIPDLS